MPPVVSLGARISLNSKVMQVTIVSEKTYWDLDIYVDDRRNKQATTFRDMLEGKAGSSLWVAVSVHNTHPTKDVKAMEPIVLLRWGCSRACSSGKSNHSSVTFAIDMSGATAISPVWSRMTSSRSISRCWSISLSQTSRSDKSQHSSRVNTQSSLDRTATVAVLDIQCCQTSSLVKNIRNALNGMSPYSAKSGSTKSITLSLKSKFQQAWIISKCASTSTPSVTRNGWR